MQQGMLKARGTKDDADESGSLDAIPDDARNDQLEFEAELRDTIVSCAHTVIAELAGRLALPAGHAPARQLMLVEGLAKDFRRMLVGLGSGGEVEILGRRRGGYSSSYAGTQLMSPSETFGAQAMQQVAALLKPLMLTQPRSNSSDEIRNLATALEAAKRANESDLAETIRHKLGEVLARASVPEVPLLDIPRPPDMPPDLVPGSAQGLDAAGYISEAIADGDGDPDDGSEPDEVSESDED